MGQNLSKQNFKILNWVLIVALLAHIIFRVIALYQSWSVNGMAMNIGFIVWIVILLSFCWNLFKEVSFYYFVVGGFAVVVSSEIFTNGEFISKLSGWSALNWIQSLDLLVIAVMAIYIWAKYYKFELLVKKK